MKILKNVGLGSLLFLVLFLINSFYALFTQQPNTTISTIMGLKINNSTTSAELYNNLSLTNTFIFVYIIFISVFLIISLLVLPKIKQSLYKNETT